VLQVRHAEVLLVPREGQEEVPLVDHAVDPIEVSFDGDEDPAVELGDLLELQLGEALLGGQERETQAMRHDVPRGDIVEQESVPNDFRLVAADGAGFVPHVRECPYFLLTHEVSLAFPRKRKRQSLDEPDQREEQARDERQKWRRSERQRRGIAFADRLRNDLRRHDERKREDCGEEAEPGPPEDAFRQVPDKERPADVDHVVQNDEGPDRPLQVLLDREEPARPFFLPLDGQLHLRQRNREDSRLAHADQPREEDQKSDERKQGEHVETRATV
jgi:hypothetical protein